MINAAKSKQIISSVDMKQNESLIKHLKNIFKEDVISKKFGIFN